jgi:glycosyltransferase
MKVSIIIPTYNSEAYVSSAIDSVLTQTYFDIECLVIDGGSTDATAAILKRYGEKITVISEKDKGIFDALNKGVAMAGGEVIGWLGSDDVYLSCDVVEKAVRTLKLTDAALCWGDLQYVAQDNLSEVRRYWKSTPYTKGLFRKGWQMAHFASFVKKEVFEKYGGFKLQFSVASDYDFFLRLLEKEGVIGAYIPEVFVKMRVGGESNKSLGNIMRGARECLAAWKENGLRINPILLLLGNLYRKIRYTYRRTKTV